MADEQRAKDEQQSNGEQRANYERDESKAERLDRNYAELLQELRVAQTGVQILFAFLLTIAFQQRFEKLNSFQRDIYLATFLSAAIAATMLIAPAAAHRVLFGRRRKDELVDFTNRVAAAGLFFLAIAMLGSVLLIIDFVAGAVEAGLLTAALAALFVVVWYLLPVRSRGRD